MIRIGINGIGRIGKLVFRLALQQAGVKVVAINDPMPLGHLAHLFKYDSVHGRLDRSFTVDESRGQLHVNGYAVSKYGFERPGRIPWKKHQVDVVVESSGRFLTRKDLQEHLHAGAPRVILSCPPTEPLDCMLVMGVNQDRLRPTDRLVSNASCTTNCVAPVLKALHQGFGLDRVLMNTVHPYTNNQCLLDAPHKDLRRARAAACNIIPTTSTAVDALQEVMPELNGRFDGFASRVPLANGSFVDLSLIVQKKTTAREINAHMQSIADGPMKGIIEYSEEPLVSGDITGNPHSAVFDALSTRVLGGNFAQVLAWYDNEYAYAHRVLELVRLMMRQ